jgi:Fe-S cluster assembly protein SufD
VNTASIAAQFDAQDGTLPRPAQQWRRDALAQFSARGFPTRRDEQWRYTDLKALQNEQFELAPERQDAAAQGAVAEIVARETIEGVSSRIVFVDGRLDGSLSDLGGATGVEIANLANSLESFEPERFTTTVGDEAETLHPLAMLNTAFVRQGALIEIAENVQVAAPLHLLFVGSGRAAPQPRIVIKIEAGASAVIVQHFVDTDEAASGWLNLVTDTVLAPDSRLMLYRLQAHRTRQFHTSLLRARLGRDSRLTAGYVDHGGKLVRNDIDVTLAEPGAHADVFGVVLAGGDQHIDNHVRVDHIAPRTTSIETFRAIVGDHAHGVFSGKVVVRPGAQRIDARQNSDNLLLSDKAEINTKPELEIYADDVKCSHGATVGELDEGQLFYLCSRGIGADEARKLLTFAFAQVILERIEPPQLRERAGKAISEQLPNAFDMEPTS